MNEYIFPPSGIRKRYPQIPVLKIGVTDDEIKGKIPIYIPSEVATLFCRFMEYRREYFKNANVLDIGAGSGVLGIYASMLGAKKIGFIETATFATECISRNMPTDFPETDYKIFNSSFSEFSKNLNDHNYNVLICNHFSSKNFASKSQCPSNDICCYIKDRNDNIGTILSQNSSKESYSGTWPGADRSLLSDVLRYISKNELNCYLLTHICEEQNPTEVIAAAHILGFRCEVCLSLKMQVEALLFGNYALEWHQKGLSSIDSHGKFHRNMIFCVFTFNNFKKLGKRHVQA